MYLPKPIYQYAPHYWVIAGILMLLLGLDAAPGSTFRYFAISIGVLSAVWGTTIFLKRRAHRQVKDGEASA